MNEVLFPYFCVSLSLANEFELNINGNNKMKKLKVLALALICAVFSPVKADEGMWLLQLMQEQNLADRMKAQGLKIEVDDITV